MNQEEANLAYEDLLETLSKHDLEWVVDQVRAHVRAGKLVDVETVDQLDRRPVVLALSTSDKEARKPRTGFTTESYTAHECLKIALNAIDVVAVQTFDIQKSLADFFGLSEGYDHAIQFQPDELDASESRIVGRPPPERSTHSEKIRELLSTANDLESVP